MEKLTVKERATKGIPSPLNLVLVDGLKISNS